jgi:multidrug resistance efflux pump
MLELLLCSLLTIVPDFLFRRYVQGKRLGKEITLYSVWFELRWGITACLILTVSLITTIFYNHPSTSNVTLFFRTVPIISETNGRVAEVYVGTSGPVTEGMPIFKLDSSRQEAAVETARRRIAEIDAEMAVAQADVQKAEGQIQEAKSDHQQTIDELETKQELQRRNPGNVPFRDIERLQVQAEGRLGAIASATAAKQSAEERISTLLPARKASAEAQLAQAEVDLKKTVVRAGVSGRVEQFALRVGDIVNPIMRPAGVLIPEGAGQRSLQAGFGQIEAQIIKVGMIAEVTCVSKPWTIIPMVVWPNMCVVATKTLEQQASLVLGRTRRLLIRQHIAIIHSICSHLAEFGIEAPQKRGVEPLLQLLADSNDARLPEMARACIAALGVLSRQLEAQIVELKRWQRQA